MRKMVALLAAAGMAMSPVAASAQAGALSLSSLSRASAPMAAGMSFFQDDGTGESNIGGGSTAVALGVLLLVLIGAVAVSGGGSDGPSSP